MVNGTVITLYLMRSGPSCADALDGCTANIAKAAAAFGAQRDGINDALAGTPYNAVDIKAGCRLTLDDGQSVRLRDAYSDPGLTTYGIDRSRAAGRELRRRVEPDLIVCSVLRRARLTAEAAFPSHDIFTAPYLAEVEDDRTIALDDAPMSPSHGGLSYVDPTRRDWASSNYHAFLTFLGGRLARKPRASKSSSLSEKITAESDHTAVAVTHGSLLKKACGLDEEPPHNTVWRRRLLVTQEHVREEPGPCDLFMSATPPVHLSVGCDDAPHKPWDVSPFLDDEAVLTGPGTFSFPDEGVHDEL